MRLSSKQRAMVFSHTWERCTQTRLSGGWLPAYVAEQGQWEGECLEGSDVQVGSHSRLHSLDLHFSESCWMPPKATEKKGAFVHFSDICNGDQVFVTIIPLHCTSPLPFWRNYSFFSPSTQNFPLAAALVVTNCVRSSLKGREIEGPKGLCDWNGKDGALAFLYSFKHF